MQLETQTEDVVDTRWVLAWREVDGEKTVKGRFVARGYQGADLRDGNVDTSGCVRRRYPLLQLISSRALK